MTEDDLKEIEGRASQATRGPWYAHRTDDQMHQNARYVSVDEGNFNHDNKCGMWAGSRDQVNPESVVAITLLQSPELAVADACDENALFIAHARSDVPRLIAEVRRLRALVGEPT